MIQDNSRENLLINLLSLESSNKRSGWDARDEFGNLYELKSTTKNTVSTARDISFNTLEAWKDKIWIVGKGFLSDIDFIYTDIYLIMPDKMDLWYEKVKNKLEKDLKIIEDTLELTEVFFDNLDKQNRIKEILFKGIKINNTPLPWKFVIDNGIKIEDNYSTNLRNILSLQKAGDKCGS